MKKNIPEYISELSDNRFEVVEDIFDNKFIKFRKLYWLLCEHSEYITTLDCVNTSKNILRVVVGFNKSADVISITDNIISNIEDDNIEIFTDERTITVEIELDETTAR